MPHLSEYEVETRFLDRLESLGYTFAPLNNYDDGQVIPPVDVPVNAENVPVGAKNAPVNAENVPVDAKYAPVNAENVSVEDEIISFCTTAKSILEIAEYLGYKDKRSVRKYLNPLIEKGRIAMTIPDKTNSRFQKYVTIQ